MVAVGIDLGTTNIGLIAIDLEECIVVESFSAPNARVPSDNGYAYLQDPVRIGDTVEELFERLPMKAASIGITGQVHGILYTDPGGKALSLLYTWLDCRGVEIIDGEIPRDRLLAQCGETLPSGYGLLTHYANRMLRAVPKGAARITGICEYVTGRLLGRPIEKTDPSCLSTFGAWDPAAAVHDSKLMAEILPPGSPAFFSAADPFEAAGITSAGIPISYPIGDNQAGFFGLVTDMMTECLVSLGTSGQFTVFSPSARRIPSMELRPFFGIGFLQVGATLCAGKAYEVLERFFLSFLKAAGLPGIEDDFVYSLMESAAAEAVNETPLTVATTLNGNRTEASLRGAITGIGLDNLSAGNLVRGTIDGIVRELRDFRSELDDEFRSIDKVIATGTVVRKNPLFVESLKRQFCLDIVVADVDDAAAVGATLVGAISAGIIDLDGRIPIIEKILKNNERL